MQDKTCAKCGGSRYSTGKGHGRYCNRCYSKILMGQIRSDPERHEKEKKKSEDYIRSHPHRTWAIAVINSHKRRGYDVKISTDELEKIANKTTSCFYCGCDLRYVRYNGHQLEAPSLDRLDNEELMTTENVVVCCRKCNSTKHNRSLDEFVQYCKDIVAKFG